MTEETIVKCTECTSRNLHKDDKRGEVVCFDCGLVLAEDVIDQSAEWNVYNPEDGDKKARVGVCSIVITSHDNSMTKRVYRAIAGDVGFNICLKIKFPLPSPCKRTVR